jgi:queuine tRNA-ribosyltransferase
MIGNFKLKTPCVHTRARLGSYTTAHGNFETPNFMPVGTRASVKGVDVERLHEAGAQIILANTYHLWLRPGHELVEKLGGIHAFSGWDGPILTDSGGFQVFSLESLRTIREEGVHFRSHIDGAPLFLSPEICIEIQERLGVDIAMVLDECPAMSMTEDEMRSSLERTLRWAKRCQEARSREDMCMFGITQGGAHPELRGYSAAATAECNFEGYAIGGLSVGEPKDVMYEVLDYHPAQLPEQSIRYLMGVGTPGDIVYAVSKGVDLFDCVMPTRSGRFARAFISGEEPYVNLKNARFREDKLPLDPNCSCICCRKYSRAYLHHLFRTDEMLGPVLLSTHNLQHYLSLMQDIRSHIDSGTFAQFAERMSAIWQQVQIGRNT